MALENLYRIPFFNVCTGKIESLKDFKIDEKIEFLCDSVCRYTYQCQLQPIFAPITFKIYGYKVNASVFFSIPYNENMENYLDMVIGDVNSTIMYTSLHLDLGDAWTSSKNLNTNQQTGISPIVSYSVLFRKEIYDGCDEIHETEIPIKITIQSELYYKILKIRSIELS